MKFVKMHGTGNDFILFTIPAEKSEVRYSGHPCASGRSAFGGQAYFTKSRIKELCDRHFGIGADGVILILPTRKKTNDFRMRIFNADGNEAEMCGNGIRCLGKLVYDYHLTSKKELLIETLSGEIPIKLFTKNNQVEKVTVNIPNKPKITPLPHSEFQSILGNKKYGVIRVLLGNPHCVIFIQNNIKNFPVEKYGPLIEKHRLFPQGTNIEFVEIRNKSFIKMRVWERGVGETLACGTGACASVVAGITKNKLQPNNVKVKLPGGMLEVSWQKILSLTGPAETVFEGNISSYK
ncbi:MAG: diaminopimelate epimerase [Planctomycetota bacterium]